MEEAAAWRQAFNQEHGTRVSVTDLVVQAVARSLREQPRMNAHVEPDRLVVRTAVNVGVATAVEDGLMVPVIPEADRLELVELSRRLRGLAEEARQGRLDPAVRGTFTVTSLGMYGTQAFLPIINPPECGILGVGAIEARVAAVGAMIGVRQRMTLTLACDHRAVNGAEAAEFLARIRRHLENDFRVA